MKTNAARFAAGLALVAFGAPFPAFGQYFPPPLIIVPPPAQQIRNAEAGLQTTAAAQIEAAGRRGPASRSTTGHYEGRTYVPD